MTDQLNWRNKLFYGDNLDIMRHHIPDDSVDLIYLDPPFNSKATYNVLFKEKNGTSSPAQITAFEDTWHWDTASEATYMEMVKNGPRKLADLLQTLRKVLGTNDMMAYVSMMSIRLVEMRNLLKDTGSIYVHLDATASHYVKLVLDAVFGPRNYRNEIVWRRSHPHGNVSRTYGKIHDVVFFYSKTDDYYWSKPHKPYFLPTGELDPEVAEHVLKQYTYVEEGTGRRFQPTSLLNPNPDRPNLTYEFMGHRRVWRWTKERMEEAAKAGKLFFPKDGKGIPREKRYLDEQEGIPLQDIWNDIPFSPATERLGYPTQKPEVLLERIIGSSSREGDLVLDPFAGCGSTVNVAERLHHRWIGIDITHLAITLMKKRLEDTFGDELAPFEVIGDPKDVGSAEALAHQNRHQFEWWALSLVDARPAQDKRKGADKGVDGYLNFFDDESGKAKEIVVQVKSGHVGASIIRDLKGTVEREKAVIGALITLQTPTGPMKKEAVSAGFYEPEHFPGRQYPRIQIMTVEDLLTGKELQYPRLAPESTFKKAQRKIKKKDEQGSLLDE